mmetsp:Transcript_84277/g.187102  ORF Transcript_84277/g.187102 Transcript_84277/m.187102 type:complete len:260 (-) Transcript_84277:332-1111(-)
MHLPEHAASGHRCCASAPLKWKGPAPGVRLWLESGPVRPYLTPLATPPSFQSQVLSPKSLRGSTVATTTAHSPCVSLRRCCTGNSRMPRHGGTREGSAARPEHRNTRHTPDGPKALRALHPLRERNHRQALPRCCCPTPRRHHCPPRLAVPRGSAQRGVRRRHGPSRPAPRSGNGTRLHRLRRLRRCPPSPPRPRSRCLSRRSGRCAPRPGWHRSLARGCSPRSRHGSRGIGRPHSGRARSAAVRPRSRAPPHSLHRAW